MTHPPVTPSWIDREGLLQVAIDLGQRAGDAFPNAAQRAHGGHGDEGENQRVFHQRLT